MDGLCDITGDLGADAGHGGQGRGQRPVPQGDFDLFQDGGGHDGVLDDGRTGDREGRLEPGGASAGSAPKQTRERPLGGGQHGFRLVLVVGDGCHANTLGQGGVKLFVAQEQGDGAGGVHRLRPDHRRALGHGGVDDGGGGLGLRSKAGG